MIKVALNCVSKAIMRLFCSLVFASRSETKTYRDLAFSRVWRVFLLLDLIGPLRYLRLLQALELYLEAEQLSSELILVL